MEQAMFKIYPQNSARKVVTERTVNSHMGLSAQDFTMLSWRACGRWAARILRKGRKVVMRLERYRGCQFPAQVTIGWYSSAAQKPRPQPKTNPPYRLLNLLPRLHRAHTSAPRCQEDLPTAGDLYPASSLAGGLVLRSQLCCCSSFTFS